MISPLHITGAALLIAMAGWFVCWRKLRVVEQERGEKQRELEGMIVRLEKGEASRLQIIEEVSHDLRTPLTSILTLFESILDAPSLSEEYVRECASVAIPEIEYVNHLIRDLFLIAQMSEPGYEPNRGTVDLVEAVREEVAHFASLSKAGTSTVSFQLKEPFPASASIQGDAHLLRRLLRNILANSRRHSRNHVKISLEGNANSEWRILIADDGPGFDPEKVASFFGRERPSMEGKSPDSDTLGLGSVIIHKIVRLHGGNLRIFNRVGPNGEVKGAAVQIVLPAEALRVPRVARAK